MKLLGFCKLRGSCSGIPTVYPFGLAGTNDSNHNRRQRNVATLSPGLERELPAPTFRSARIPLSSSPSSFFSPIPSSNAVPSPFPNARATRELNPTFDELRSGPFGDDRHLLRDVELGPWPLRPAGRFAFATDFGVRFGVEEESGSEGVSGESSFTSAGTTASSSPDPSFGSRRNLSRPGPVGYNEFSRPGVSFSIF